MVRALGCILLSYRLAMVWAGYGIIGHGGRKGGDNGVLGTGSISILVERISE